MKNIITDFGAVGDGVTDDTLAFQNAAASGYYVEIPNNPNTYKVTARSSLQNGSGFIGQEGATILHQGSDWFCDIQGNDTALINLKSDGTSNTGSGTGFALLRTDLGAIRNTTIKNIKGIAEQFIVSDNGGVNYANNLRISDIVFQQHRGNGIYLTNANIQLKVRDVLIDFTGSSSPNFTGVYIGPTYGMDLNGIEIYGSNSPTYTNQHGIVLVAGEHARISNIDAQYMGGYGFWGQSCVNARITNSNFYQGNYSAQARFDNASDCQMSNSMMRGKANGDVSPIITSGYGLIVNNCLRMAFSGNHYKSNGGGVWQQTSYDIAYGASAFTVNYYWGFVSTGANTNTITGSVFTYNGSGNADFTAAGQHLNNCTNQTGGLISLNGIGTI